MGGGRRIGPRGARTERHSEWLEDGENTICCFLRQSLQSNKGAAGSALRRGAGSAIRPSMAFVAFIDYSNTSHINPQFTRVQRELDI